MRQCERTAYGMRCVKEPGHYGACFGRSPWREPTPVAFDFPRYPDVTPVDRSRPDLAQRLRESMSERARSTEML